jgi:histidyl-tRNA synthetase
MERLPGFRDFYPEPLPNTDVWSADARNTSSAWRSTARRYGFREYDGPPLEPLELFTTKSGDEIVGQLYNFKDKGERGISLRPEMTPTLARMVAAHERAYKKPIKWFAIPQLFRYERQQKGPPARALPVQRGHHRRERSGGGRGDHRAAHRFAARARTDRGRFRHPPEQPQAWQQFFAQRCSDPAKEYDFYQIIDKLEREDPTVKPHEARQARLQLRRRDGLHHRQPADAGTSARAG